MVNTRSLEVRLWWPMPLAVIVWLIIMWGTGFVIKTPVVETQAPKPIEARFIELPEPMQQQKKRLPPPPVLAKRPSTEPLAKPKISENIKPARPLTPPSQLGKAKAKVDAVPDIKPSPTLDAPTDLMAFVNQARARRGDTGIVHAPEVRQHQPTEDEIRMDRVRRNLIAPGTSGIFKITRMGVRTAQFSFRGWITNYSRPRLEIIEVDAGPDGDIRRAIIRRMIQLIREYHQGNFNWESYRLNSVVVLSAHMRDNQGLEDFLMREFFD